MKIHIDIMLEGWGPVRVKPFRMFWLPFSRRFDDILSELQTYQNAVADEVGHAHIIEEADFRALVRTRGERLNVLPGVPLLFYSEIALYMEI
jgi:hypothetical protein